jgi:hypothetical protein
MPGGVGGAGCASGRPYPDLLTHGALSERSARRARSELRRASPRRAAQGNRPEGPVAAVLAGQEGRLTLYAAARAPDSAGTVLNSSSPQPAPIADSR